MVQYSAGKEIQSDDALLRIPSRHADVFVVCWDGNLASFLFQAGYYPVCEVVGGVSSLVKCLFFQATPYTPYTTWGT